MRCTTAALAAALILAAGCGGGSEPEPAAPVEPSATAAPATTRDRPPPTQPTLPPEPAPFVEDTAPPAEDLLPVEDTAPVTEDTAPAAEDTPGDAAPVEDDLEIEPGPEQTPAAPETTSGPTVIVEPPTPEPSLIEEDVLPEPDNPDPAPVGEIVRLEATALLRDRMELGPLAFNPEQLIWDQPFDSLREGTRWEYRVCGAPELEDLGIETWAADKVVTTPTKLDDPGRRMPEWSGQVSRTISRVAPGNDEPYEYDPPEQVPLLAYYDEPNDRWWLPAPAPCVR